MERESEGQTDKQMDRKDRMQNRHKDKILTRALDLTGWTVTLVKYWLASGSLEAAMERETEGQTDKQMDRKDRMQNRHKDKILT